MRLWKRAGAWFEATLGRSRREREMDAELWFRLEARTEDLVGAGREEVRRQAQMEFGGVERAKEECRDARGVNFVEGRAGRALRIVDRADDRQSLVGVRIPGDP